MGQPDRRGEPPPVVDERPLVDRPELVPTPTTPGSSERDARHRQRLTRRVALGVAIGVVAGALLGLVLGVIAFSSTTAVIGAVIASAAAVGGLGAFWGGMASLESTDAGAEPTQTDEPLEQRGVSTESDEQR